MTVKAFNDIQEIETYIIERGESMFSLKKLLIGLLVFVLLFSTLQGCSRSWESGRDESEREDKDRDQDYDDKDGDEDDDDDNDDRKTDKGKKAKNKKAVIDEEYEWLIGSWFYSEASGNVGFTCIYEFKEDGTFTKAIGTISGYSRYAIGFEGDFKISGDKLVFYNQLKSEAQAAEQESEWWYLKMADSVMKDIPVDDEEKHFEKDDDGNLVIDGTVCEKIDL